MDSDEWGTGAGRHPHYYSDWDDSKQRKKEAKARAKEAAGKRKKEPYLPFGKALPRHRLGQNHMTEMELAELSKETLQKYRDTSSLEIGKAKAKKAWAQHDAKRDPSPENYQKQNDAEHAIQKRTKGQELVKKKLSEDNIEEGTKDPADHTKGDFHKVLTKHGFTHSKTIDKSSDLHGTARHVHVYTHPDHGKSHVEAWQYHDGKKTFIKRHEQSNGIMAPSSGDTKGQLDKALTREYGSK